MPTLKNTDKEQLYFSTLLFDNNPASTLAAFGLPANTSKSTAIEFMINLARTHKNIWIEDIKKVIWDLSNKNYTNNDNVLQILADTYNERNGTKITVDQIRTGQIKI